MTAPEIHRKAPSLKLLRASKGLTLKQLSELSGVPIETISRIENGHRQPHLNTVKKLADAFDIEPSVFLDGQLSVPSKSVDPGDDLLEAAQALLECLDTGLGDSALRLAQLRVAVAKVEGKA